MAGRNPVSWFSRGVSETGFLCRGLVGRQIVLVETRFLDTRGVSETGFLCRGLVGRQIWLVETRFLGRFPGFKSPN